jgi:hypothetical protein
MPRKKLIHPATASTVLEFFQTRELGTAEVILELASAEVAKRRPKAAPVVTSTAKRAPRRPPAAPAEYGESLKDA